MIELIAMDFRVIGRQAELLVHFPYNRIHHGRNTVAEIDRI